MKTDGTDKLWNEICFLLHDNVKPDINEKDFENQVVRATEKLGWLEFAGEIKRQPTLKIGRSIRIRPDIVVYSPKGNELIAIEIKRPSEDISREEPADQLISYMLQMKAEFGLLIGKRIRLYYDGKHNPQHKPLLLDKIDYEKDSEKGNYFVSIFNKENFLKKASDNIIKELIKKVVAKKNIKELRRELLTLDTRNEIINFLKNKFSEYGSEVVEGAFTGLDIGVTIKAEEVTDVIGIDDGSGLTGLRKTVYDTIKNRRNGISKAEITKLTGFEKKQISNALFYLSEKKMVRTLKRGVYIPRSQKKGIYEIADKKESILSTQGPTRKSKQNVFIESLDKNGQRVFKKLLDFAKSESFPIHWGVKGFSLNVDLDGIHVYICFCYPPNSVFKQSLYTRLMVSSGILYKTNATEELVQSLLSDAQETGLFQQAGRELKCMINRNMTEKEIDSLLSWCKKVADLIKKSGLKK